MPISPKRRLLAILFALATVAAALVLRYETAEHVASGQASACTLSARIDCDAVQSSAYARVAGVSLSVLGAAASLILAAWLIALRGRTLLAAAGVLALFNLGWAVYAAAISTFVLEVVCLYCIAMQVGIAVVAILVLPPAWRAVREGGFTMPRVLHGGLLAVVILGLALAGDAYADQRANLRALYERPSGRAVRVDLAGALTLGSPDTPHSVVVYFDFGCPFCKKCYDQAVYLLRKYPRAIHFTFKHFPLDRECVPEIDATAHPLACRAAAAGQAAAAKGKTAPAMARLFGTQDFSWPAIDALGRDLAGLDKAAWRAELRSDEVVALRQRDIDEFNGMKQVLVPTSFLDGRPIDSSRMVQAVERLLGK